MPLNGTGPVSETDRSLGYPATTTCGAISAASEPYLAEARLRWRVLR